MNTRFYKETAKDERMRAALREPLREAHRLGLDAALIGRFLDVAIAPVPMMGPTAKRAAEAQRKRTGRAVKVASERAAEALAKAAEHDGCGPTETGRSLRVFAAEMERAEVALASPTPLAAMRECLKYPDVTLSWELRAAVLEQHFRDVCGDPCWRLVHQLLDAAATLRNAGPVPTCQGLERAVRRRRFPPRRLQVMWNQMVAADK